MDIVKRERIKQRRLENGDTVSVPGEYFDDMDVEFYYGTVELASSLDKKVHVKWDIDGTFTHVNVEDEILDKNTPKQGRESSQIDNNVETDFSRNEIEISSGATSQHNKSNISENSTEQKAGKSKFQLRLKAPSPTTNSSSDSDNDFDDKTREIE